jgi:hypothetical protein
MGGFAAIVLYGLNRQTAHIDVLEIAPTAVVTEFRRLRRYGRLSAPEVRNLSRSRGSCSCARMVRESTTEMFPGTCEHLHLMALDPYNLALSKPERNIQRDRDGVRHLARTVPFDLDMLQGHYKTELRWQMANPNREDLKLKLWIDAILEERESKQFQ